jgi:hypothetical protein
MYLLVDNATITGVHRLLGQIKVRSRDAIDGDIAALENVIQGILFYDDIIAIDDYKEGFRLGRKNNFEFLRWLDPEKYMLPDIAAIAQEASAKLHPEIRGGEFADSDFKKFMDLLKLNIVCTWDMSSSVYFLTMKLLGMPEKEDLSKYSKLCNTIFSELTDLSRSGGEYDKSVSLYDSRGVLIDSTYRLKPKGGNPEPGGLTPALESFVASLRWLSYRTIFYSEVARHLQADLMLHPIRHMYHLHYMQKAGVYDGNFISDVIQCLNDEAKKSIESVINANRPVRLSLTVPIFSGWLVNKTQDVKLILEAAHDLREDSAFKESRDLLREIRSHFDEGDVQVAVKEVIRLQEKIKSNIAEINRKFGVRNDQGLSVQKLIKVIAPSVSLIGGPKIPEHGGAVYLPEFLITKRRYKGFCSIYRQITQDLSNYPKMGKARDMLAQSVVIDPDLPSFSAKTEDPRFRYVTSNWKVPMSIRRRDDRGPLELPQTGR